MQLKAVLLVLGLIVPALPVQANGVISEFRAGGVVFKESATISIAREDLYLSAREIRVHYLYQSDAEAVQRVTIGFPMPPVPLDSSPDYLGGVSDDLPDPRNYLQFVARVNGAPVETVLHEYAYLNGFNVTEELQTAGVPLFLPYEAVAGVLEALDEPTRARLVEHGLFSAFDEGFESWMPMWRYQTVYEWEQDFAPGATEVEIGYVPLNGYPSDIGNTFEGGDEWSDPYFQASLDNEYCIDNQLKSAIQKRRAAGQHYEVVTQGYIVQTANYWSGTIAEFNLIVDKADPVLGEPFDLVAFCPPTAQKVSETQFKWTAESFWPSRDIAVAYYKFYNVE